MRWLSLLVGAVFAAAGLKALFFFDPNTAALSRRALVAVSLGGAALFFFLFVRTSRVKRDLSEFESWLQANGERILAGGASYRGARITGDTEVTRFLLAASVVILSFKIPSRYYVAGRDNVGFTKMGYTVASLLFGWWGIPWGPIYTVQALAKNLSGGDRTTVRSYLMLHARA